MKSTDLDRRQTILESLIRKAGTLALSYFQNPQLETSRKGVQDLVTQADLAVEDFLISHIHQEFPTDGFVGEERGNQSPTGPDQSFWVIDPIDGTANFARRVPTWCVSVALVSDGNIELGAIFHPLSGDLFLARRGQGATRNGLTMKVSPVNDPEDAITGLGFSYRRAPQVHAAEVLALLERHCEYRRIGSAALSLAYVADGRLEGLWEAHVNSWDVLAGLCLVREAGGWINDFLQNDGLHQGNRVLACAPGMLGFYRELFGVGEV